MEKHSFDRRLAERLWQHEKTPRPEAWKRLEERMGRKEERRRIVPFWYYGVAASVAVLLLAGIWWWDQPDGKVQPQVAVQIQPKAPLPKQTVVPHAAKPQTPPVVPPTTTPASTQLAVQQVKTPRAARQDASVKSTPVKVTDEKITSAVPVEVAVAEPTPEKVVPGNEPANIPVVPASQLQLAVVETPQVSSTVLVVKLTGPEPDIQLETQSRKRVRLIKIFNQLKNAKNGEHVDWREVGFNPNTVLARAEERLERSTEKVNQSYRNLKDKTNF